MIDFRYHLVSIVAVFLALGIGIVIGTTALNGAVLNDLQRRVDGLLADRRDLEEQVADLNAGRAADAGFAEAVAPSVVDERLDGRDVVVVAADGASEDALERVRSAVETADGTVTGTIRLSADWGVESEAAAVDDVVVEALPAGVILPDGNPWDRAATLLAAALVDPADGVGALPQGSVSDVLQTFRTAGLLQVQDDTVSPGTLAVVVGAPGEDDPPPSGSPGPSVDVPAQRVASLARALDRRGEGAVVVGGTGDAVAAVRADESLRRTLSTVAPVRGAPATVALVLALVEQAAGGSGHYGLTGDVDGVVPDLAALSGLPALPGAEDDESTEESPSAAALLPLTPLTGLGAAVPAQ